MRRISMSLLSTSVIAIAVAATPAAAQTTDPATPPDPTVEAQTTPAPDQGAPQTDDAVQTASGQDQATSDGDTIVVTGLRRSLQSAQNIKRNSEQIVDVIVAEDIGKLPDRTVSEAIARVPGVFVERARGEAGEVYLRGLRDPATTYNGRDIFTADARNVAPQDFPAGSVAALEVFKSQTAEQIEGNLAGLINVRSRRPFDFKGLEVSGMVNATYADLADDTAWNGNILVSDRFDTPIGEMGILANASYTELTYKDTIRWASGDFFGINPSAGDPDVYCDNFDFGCLGGAPAFNVPGTTIKVPVAIGLHMNAGRRWRPAGNVALQWRATPDLQIYVDGLYQGYRRQTRDRTFGQVLYAAPSYTNVTTTNDPGDDFEYFGGGTMTPCCVAEGWQAATWEKTNTYQGAVGGVWDTDTMRVGVDLARTTSKFDLQVAGLDYRWNDVPTIDAEVDTDGDGGAQFDFTGVDPTDLDLYEFRGFYDRRLVAKGDDWQFRVDTTFKDLAPWVRGVDVGVRYNDRDAGFQDADRYFPVGPGTPYGSLPLDFHIVDWEFRDGEQGVTQLNLPTYGSIRDAIPELRAMAGFPAGDPEPNLFQQYTVNEKGYTGYAQLRYQFDAGDIPIEGAIGLRAVKTKFSLDSAINVGGDVQPLEVRNDYVDYLPNASIRARITPDIVVRAAYTETRRRPDFSQLRPNFVVGPPPPAGEDRTASGGNPFLKPILSNNYDLSLEYYFARTGFAALALFRRDVRNYIVTSVSEIEIPDIGPVDLSGPANSDKGRIQGAEAQVRTFFDFASLPSWLHGFGVEANVTYIDASLDAPPDFVDQSDINFPEVSKWSYNLVGFYEQGPLTARVAYNFRSNYVLYYENRADSVAGEFTDDVDRLDASVSYALTDNVTLAADVSNILGKPFRTFRTTGDNAVYPRDVRYEERVYSFGVRFRMGGRERAAPLAVAPMLPPPPPPVVEPAPVEVAPPPPPPPPPIGERG